MAIGFSRYPATADQAEQTFHNAFLLSFGADDRCTAFREFYMLERD